MNISLAEADTVRALCCELLREHLDQDTAGMDGRASLALFRRIAKDNRAKYDAGDPAWQGLAFELDPAMHVG